MTTTMSATIDDSHEPDNDHHHGKTADRTCPEKGFS